MNVGLVGLLSLSSNSRSHLLILIIQFLDLVVKLHHFKIIGRHLLWGGVLFDSIVHLLLLGAVDMIIASLMLLHHCQIRKLSRIILLFLLTKTI